MRKHHSVIRRALHSLLSSLLSSPEVAYCGSALQPISQWSLLGIEPLPIKRSIKQAANLRFESPTVMQALSSLLSGDRGNQHTGGKGPTGPLAKTLHHCDKERETTCLPWETSLDSNRPAKSRCATKQNASEGSKQTGDAGAWWVQAQ